MHSPSNIKQLHLYRISAKGSSPFAQIFICIRGFTYPRNVRNKRQEIIQEQIFIRYYEQVGLIRQQHQH